MVDKPKQANRRALYLRLPPITAAIIEQEAERGPWGSRQELINAALSEYIINHGLKLVTVQRP